MELRSNYRLFLAVICVSTLALTASKVRKIKPPPPPHAGYYVVVAAYTQHGEGYAQRFADYFNNQGVEATFIFFPEKNMIFVHLGYFTDRETSISKMRNVRKDGICSDAWVYVYKPDGEEIVVKPAPPPAEDKEETIAVEAKEIEEDIVDIGQDEQQKAKEVIDVVEEVKDDPLEVIADGKISVYLNLHFGVSQDLVEGDIQLVDPERGRLIGNLVANTTNRINKPSNIHDEAQFIADIFGYRKIVHTIDLEDPRSDSTDYFVKEQGDSIIVNFELVRFHAGDIFTMYHVYFFSHSAIMRSESSYELDQLLTMLNENPNLEIRIHGHTNSNNAGDISVREDGDTNFFSRTGSYEIHASAKDLSEKRANVVKQYLEFQGVPADRMEIKGWGGKRMLYKKNDPQAIKNVRVEIEILSE